LGLGPLDLVVSELQASTLLLRPDRSCAGASAVRLAGFPRYQCCCRYLTAQYLAVKCPPPWDPWARDESAVDAGVRHLESLVVFVTVFFRKSRLSAFGLFLRRSGPTLLCYADEEMTAVI
jgi:hypothetical protein